MHSYKAERAKGVALMSEPGVVKPSWSALIKELVAAKSPPTAFIDGYVKAKPGQYDRRGFINFDHHYYCDRASTRASCMQVVYAIRYDGFYGAHSPFVNERGEPNVVLRTQGADLDVGFSTDALMYPDHVENAHFREDAALEDPLDTFNGKVRVKTKWHRLREVTWIGEESFAFQRRLRHEKRRATPQECLDIIYDQHHRIALTLAGRGEEREPDVAYTVLEKRDEWDVIREDGPFARFGLARDHIDSFVTVAELGEGEGVRYEYRAIRPKFAGTFGSFDRLAKRLNKLEGYGKDSKVKWGGSNLCFCSPYDIGTSIPPAEFNAILEEEHARAFKRA